MQPTKTDLAPEIKELRREVNQWMWSNSEQTLLVGQVKKFRASRLSYACAKDAVTQVRQ